MADGTIKIGVDIDEKGFSKELQGLEKQSTKVGGNISNIFSKAFKGFSVAIAGATTALSGLGLAVSKVGKDFEAQMSKVEAISGSTAEEMELLEAKAKELGATTQFSATEAGQALEYMALAGFKTEDMLDSLSGVMDLAAASGEDLGLVSDILTDGLTAFGLSAKEAGRFADVLAAASSNSNTNVAMLGESFKYVAPVAGALGYSIEDTATALGLMANAGIKASQSGTALRTILTNLTSTSKPVVETLSELGVVTTDSAGNMLPLNDILVQLRGSFAGLSEVQQAQYAKTLAGQEGMSGLLAIVNASEADFNKLSNAINNSNGKAGEMAQVMNDNLAGAIKNLQSALEGVALTIYDEIKEPLKETIQTITEFVTGLQTAFEEGGIQGLITEFKERILELFPALTPLFPIFDLLVNAIKFLADNMDILLPIIVGVTSAMVAYKASMLIANIINGVVNAINFFKTAAEGATIAQKLLNLAMSMNPFVLITTLLVGLVAALVTLWNTNENFRNAVINIWTKIKEGFINVATTISTLFTETIPNSIESFFDKIKELPSRFIEIGKNIVTGLWEGIKNTASWLKDKIKGFVSGIVANVKGFFGIKSPSRLFRDEIGVMLVKGMAVGVEQEEDTLVDALTNPYDLAKDNIMSFSDDVSKILKDTNSEMGFMESLNKKMPQLQASINATNNSMIPTGSINTMNNSKIKNITNNQGDFVLRIDNFNAGNKMDINTLLTEASFYQKQRNNAIGVTN